MSSRRAFLKFVAGSPLFAGMPFLADAFAQAPLPDSIIAAAGEAINVFDLEAAARKALPAAHWGYMATGVDDDGTLKANREAFARYQLRARVFVDVSKIDMSTELFGTRYDIPIVLAPVGSQKAFHPQGEVAVAKAAQSKKALQILSTQTSSAVEDVISARNAPIWYQLYTTNSWDVTQKLVKRAERAGCPVVAVTVDLPKRTKHRDPGPLSKAGYADVFAMPRRRRSAERGSDRTQHQADVFGHRHERRQHHVAGADMGFHTPPEGRHQHEGGDQGASNPRGRGARGAQRR